MATLAQNVRRLMAERLISYKMLSNSCDISFSLISNIRNGHIPQLPILKCLALAFNVTLEELCGDTPCPVDLPKIPESVHKTTNDILIERMLLEGLRPAQISRVLGVSPQAVDQRIKSQNMHTVARPVRKKTRPSAHQLAVARAAMLCGLERYRIASAFGEADWVNEVDIKNSPDGVSSSDRQLMIAFFLGKGFHSSKAARAAGIEYANSPDPFKVRNRLKMCGIDVGTPDGRFKARGEALGVSNDNSVSGSTGIVSSSV